MTTQEKLDQWMMTDVRRQTTTRVELLPIDTFDPAPYNPRRDLTPEDEEYQAIATSLDTWGLVDPLVGNARTRRLVGGHQRLKILKAKGYQLAHFSIVDTDEDNEIALNIALNKTGGGWDMPKLSDALSHLDAHGFDATLTGFGYEELEDVLTWTREDVVEDGESLGDEAVDAIEEDIDLTVPEVAKSERGVVYELGRHRVMCGDATVRGDVEKLMGGVRAGAVLTDPPYGQNQPGVTNDDPASLEAIAGGSVALLPVDDAVVVAFQSPRTFPAWLDAIRTRGKFERMLWLYKAAPMAHPWRGWIMKSEAILVATIGQGAWQDEHPYSHDCYYLSEVSGELDADLGWHGSIKPLSVVRDLMRRISPAGSVVYDAFLGSGTTLIAAEAEGRTCYAMELDPKNVDVVRRRYAAFVGDPSLEP